MCCITSELSFGADCTSNAGFIVFCVESCSEASACFATRLVCFAAVAGCSTAGADCFGAALHCAISVAEAMIVKNVAFIF